MISPFTLELWDAGRVTSETAEEYPKADLWITANPKKKRKKWLSFLSNWMEIAAKKNKADGDNFRPKKKRAQKKTCQGCDEEVENLYPGGVCARCYSTDPRERRGDI